MRQVLQIQKLAGILGAVLAAAGPLSALVSPECVRPGDHYAAPSGGLTAVDFGKVALSQSELPDGTPVPLFVGDCNNDGSLDVVVPWSEATGAKQAAIRFDKACDGELPKGVVVEFTLGVAVATWRAHDAGGAVVDTGITPSTGTLQSVTLGSAGGIRFVSIEGAEICITRICWGCDDVPEGDCVEAHEYYPAPAANLPFADLGPIRVRQAALPDGTPVPLSIEDCSNDGRLDLVIPWSGKTAAPPATFSFRGACTPGVFPRSVEITFRQGVASVEWRAYDLSHTLLDAEVTAAAPGEQTVTLESPAGIFEVEVTGAELCITRICWRCDREPGQYGDCASVHELHPAPGGPLESLDLGPILVTGAKLPSGEPSPMEVRDCDDDGRMDLGIRWSGRDAAQLATLHVFRACGEGSLPVSVTVKLLTDNAVLHAFDSAGIEVDTAAAAPVYAVQSLTVASPGGIARIGIEGSQMCLVEVCWRCPERRKEFLRGDSNGDGVLDLSDAVNTLAALFSGAPFPACADAADSNDDGEVDISDPMRALRYLFLGAEELPGGPACAPDATLDRLDCSESPCS
jgi:hypothetical protein